MVNKKSQKKAITKKPPKKPSPIIHEKLYGKHVNEVKGRRPINFIKHVQEGQNDVEKQIKGMDKYKTYIQEQGTMMKKQNKQEEKKQEKQEEKKETPKKK